MALLKAPSKQPKTTNLQVRLEEEVRHNLDRYAEFLDANPSYVVCEALKLLFRKDDEFKRWATHTQATSIMSKSKETFSKRPHSNHEIPFSPIRCAREYSVLKTACPALCSAFDPCSIYGPSAAPQDGMSFLSASPQMNPHLVPRTMPHTRWLQKPEGKKAAF